MAAAARLALTFALISAARGNLEAILRRIPQQVQVEEEMLEGCLKKMAETYKYNNRDLVLMVQNERLDISRLSRNWAGHTLENGVKFGSSLTVQVVRRYVVLPHLLKRTRWTRKTVFILAMKRIPGNDNFFVDMDHQRIRFDVVTDRDIERDFAGYGTSNETIHVRDMRNAFGYFWRSRVTNVVFLVPKMTNVYVYTYFPFTERNCPDKMTPVLTNVWFSETGDFYRGHNLFPDKVRNLNGCPLNVSLISSPPGVMAEKGNIDGIEGELLKYVFLTLNATPSFHFVNQQEVFMNDTDTALRFVLQKVRSGESELGAGFLIHTGPLTGRMDDIHVGVSLCVTWAVPNREDVSGAVLPITDTFTNSVWAFIGCTTVISGVILWYLLRPGHRRSLLSSTFQIVAVTLGKPVILPKEKLPKSFLIVFIWYSVILVSAFQAGLGSNNIVSSPPPRFESTREILESRYDITGAEFTVHLFKKDIKLIRRDGSKVSVEPMDIHNALVKVAFEKRTAYIGFKLAMSYYILFLMPELMDHIYIHKTCLVKYQTFFALRRNSPFSTHIRTIVYELIEGGFKENLERKYLARMMKSQRRRRVMSKGDALVRGSLAILMLGLWLSVWVFLAECAFYRLKRWLGLLVKGKRRMD